MRLDNVRVIPQSLRLKPLLAALACLALLADGFGLRSSIGEQELDGVPLEGRPDDRERTLETDMASD